LFFNYLPGGAYELIEVERLADQLSAGLAWLLLSRASAICELASIKFFMRNCIFSVV